MNNSALVFSWNLTTAHYLCSLWFAAWCFTVSSGTRILHKSINSHMVTRDGSWFLKHFKTNTTSVVLYVLVWHFLNLSELLYANYFEQENRIPAGLCAHVMARVLLSDEQHDYIVQGVREDFRNDGRSCKDYRKFELSTGMITNANASARVKLVSL